MKQQFIWNGSYYNSKEVCVIDYTEREILINSAIKGSHKTLEIDCEYRIKATPDWRVASFEVHYVFNKLSQQVSGLYSDKGWIINGQQRTEFENCIDIDITLTPFTNSLPINRLKLPVNAPHQIDVLYINVLENRIYPVKQQYTKKSETEYNFQNVPNDFEADIITDKDGFVVHYPELFEQVD